MSDLWNLEKSARADLHDRWENYRDEFDTDDPHDVITELADSWTPIYTADLLRLALDNLDFAVTEPEIGPAFDGTPTPVNVIAANVYEHLTAELYDEWSRIEADELEKANE